MPVLAAGSVLIQAADGAGKFITEKLINEKFSKGKKLIKEKLIMMKKIKCREFSKLFYPEGEAFDVKTFRVCLLKIFDRGKPVYNISVEAYDANCDHWHCWDETSCDTDNKKVAKRQVVAHLKTIKEKMKELLELKKQRNDIRASSIGEILKSFGAAMKAVDVAEFVKTEETKAN